MISGLKTVPSHLRQRLAQALEAGQLEGKPTVTSLRFTVGTDEFADVILPGLEALAEKGVSGSAAGAWLRMLDDTALSIAIPDVVWSGPGVPGLFARDTRRVYEELLSSAEKSVWASTYAFFDGPKAFEILAKRLDERPNLSVNLLLNIQRKKGDTTAADHLVRGFADHFWKVDWPGGKRPKVYYDPRSLDLDGPAGVLHAKAVVVDHESTFITSANLTEAALDRNIELGVLLRDRAFALTVTGYFQALIDKNLLKLLPSA